jgi:hypothetical protein
LQKKARQLLLNDETALIEYFIGQQSSYAFILSKDNVQLMPLPAHDSIQLALKQLEKQLFQTQAFQLNPKEAFALFNQAAFHVHQAILADAINMLPPYGQPTYHYSRWQIEYHPV